jgi:hypothetical protein
MTAKRLPWTEEDVRRLRLLAEAGIGAVNIAKTLGRSRASVTQKAHWLNLPLAQKGRLSATIGAARGKHAPAH